MNKKFTLLTVLFCLFVSTIQAQISVTTLSQTYNQDFNTLASAGVTSAILPSGWAVKGNSYRVGNGASNSGGIYSFGFDTTSTDRALGSVASGSFAPGLYGIQFVNNTGAIITSINVDFNVELWRLGQKPALRLDSIILAYNIGVDSLQATGWTDVPSLVAKTPDTSGVLGAINGNLPLNRKQITGTITGLSISSGAKFWLRWTDPNISGNDDGLAVDDLNISFGGSVATPCTTPAAAPTSLVLTPSGNSVSGSFTASGSATKYLVVVSSSPSLGQTPTNGVVYSAGTSFGSGTVVQSSASTSFNATGLAGGANYYFSVFALNDACVGEPYYLTTPLSGNTTTTCGEPTVKPTNIQFTFVNNTSIQGKFNKAVPAPNGYVVVFSTSSNVAYPLDSITYAVGDSINYSSFKSKVAYVGTDSNFSVSGLTQGTRYYFAVLPYTSCSYGPNYLRTTPLKGDTITSGSAPLVDCVQPSGVSNVSIVKVDSTSSSITINFTLPGNADSVMVFAGPTATVGFVTLNDSVYYGVGSSILTTNGATPPVVYYRGTGSSNIVLSPLLANTVYKIFVVSFNNKACNYGPNYAGIATTTIKTAAGAPGDCIQPSGVSNTSIIKLDSTATTISIKYTLPSNADSVMVLAGPTATIGFVTLHDSIYYAVGSIIPGSQATVYYRGTDSSVVLTGLTPNTVYKILIATFNNKACTYGPNYSGLATTTIRTAIATGIRNNTSEAEFSMYPNPVSNGMLNLKFRNILKEEALVQIVDIAGRVLSAQKINSGNNTHMIDVRNLAKGTYVLNVVYKGANSVSSFVIQ